MTSVLEPFALRRLSLRNRLVQGATVTNLGRNDALSDEQISFYAERAAGGVGAVVTEGLAVHPSSIPTHTVPLAYDAELIPDFSRLATAVHAGGALLLGQLWHAGRQALWNPMQLPWSASSERDPYSGSIPHAMSLEEIGELVDAFGRAARNLRDAGFDGVELHGAHGYLLTQFLSRWSNRRTDEYGGIVGNRARLVTDLVERVRAECGEEFVVGLKLSAAEGVPDGIELDDAQALVAHIVATAPPDYFAVSQGNFSPSLEWHTPDMRFGDGHFRHLWRGVREVSGEVPVMAIGKIPGVELAQSILDDGDADLVAMTRALLADPRLPEKHTQGRKPRPCVYCNLCWHQIHTLRPVGCFYAPDAPESPASAGQHRRAPGARRDVRVVGAGLAGLEFARTAASLGHAVRIYEARDRPGGRLLAEAAVPGREAMGEAAQWLVDEVLELGVGIELGTPVDSDEIEAWPADAVVVQATGASAVVEPLPGAPRTLSLEWAMSSESELTGRIAVIDEIDDEPVYAACEALAGQGLDVRLITRRPAIGRHVPWVNLIGVLRRLDEAGVSVETMAVADRVENDELVLAHALSRRELGRGRFDSIVCAGPFQPATPLAIGQRALVVVGDALSPRGLQSVALEAHSAALSL